MSEHEPEVIKLQTSETEDGGHVYKTSVSSSLEQEVINLLIIRAFLISFPLIGFIEFSVPFVVACSYQTSCCRTKST